MSELKVNGNVPGCRLSQTLIRKQGMDKVLFRLCLIFLLGLSLGACQASGNKPTEALAYSGNSDALLATGIALYADTRDPAQALEPIRRAAQQSPQSAELQWLYAHLCRYTAGCDAAAAEMQLRKIDSGNGVVWLGALARAQQQRDAATETQLLETLSRSERLDLYWNSLIARTAVALRQTRPDHRTGIEDALTKSLNTATEQLSTIAVAALRPITAACSAERVQSPAVATHCSQIAQILQRSDTYMAAGVGLGIQERLATPGSAEAQTVNERVRVARYQQETAGNIMENQVDRAALSRELIELLRSLRREQDVFSAVLRWAGQPTTPPAQWQAATQ